MTPIELSKEETKTVLVWWSRMKYRGEWDYQITPKEYELKRRLEEGSP